MPMTKLPLARDPDSHQSETFAGTLPSDWQFIVSCTVRFPGGQLACPILPTAHDHIHILGGQIRSSARPERRHRSPSTTRRSPPHRAHRHGHQRNLEHGLRVRCAVRRPALACADGCGQLHQGKLGHRSRPNIGEPGRGAVGTRVLHLTEGNRFVNDKRLVSTTGTP
uniref:Uncharacterized protein n=1 Tax=Ralstonia solanacearum TaxID=305 RepID=A0A0S4TQ29_RALSL|nr:protein of unknown function [Ralstonia solanacearum]